MQSNSSEVLDLDQAADNYQAIPLSDNHNSLSEPNLESELSSSNHALVTLGKRERDEF